MIIDAFGDLREQLDSVKETLEVKIIDEMSNIYDDQFSFFSPNASFVALAKIISIKNRTGLR